MALRIPESPYVGLVPYTEQQWDLFVGRESETQVIIDNLRGARLTLLYGPTGVGKTSVLRAGVVHRLRELARENFEDTGSPEFVPVYFNAWRDDPLAGLARCVRDSAALVTDEPEPPPEPPQPQPLELTLKNWCDKTQGDLLLILDQFEEYFLYHGREQGPGAFDYEFPRAVNRPDLRVNFLVSIREDMLSKLDSFKGRIPNLFGNYLRVEHLSRKAAEKAIREPLHKYNDLKAAEAKSAGLPTPAVKYDVEEDLVKAVCDQLSPDRMVVGPAGGGWVVRARGRPPSTSEKYIEAPFLQLVMNTLWEKETIQHRSHLLRRKTLTDLGGAFTIVKTHLNGEMKRLSPEEQDVAAKIFYHLVTPTGEKIAHAVRDLSAYTNLPPEQIEPVLERLASGNVRLIRHITAESGRSQMTRYEIFHDVLVAAVLDWREQYMRKLQRREQEQERQKEALAKLRAELEAQKQRHRARRLRYLTGFATLMALLCFSLWLYARSQSKAAREANKQLEQERGRLATLVELVDKQDHTMPYFEAVMRGHQRGVKDAAFSPDGKRLATGSDDGTARVWDAATGLLLRELPHPSPVSHTIFTPDGRLITGTEDGRARVWNIETGLVQMVVNAHSGRLNDFALSPDGGLLATAGGDGVGRVFDLATGTAVGVLEGHRGGVNAINFSDDGKLVVTGSDDFTVRVWNVRGGPSLHVLGDSRNAVNSVALSPKGGALVVAASADWNVYLWDTSTGQLVATLSGHTGPVNSAAFSPDGALAVSASDDKTVRVWDLKTNRVLHDLRGHSDAVAGAEFNRSGLRVISASADYTARVWDVVNSQLLAELRGHTGAVNSAAFSRDGNSAATASEDTTARVWGITDSGGLRIDEVKLRAVPDKYSGPCPAAIRLLGRINVVGVSGTVRYRFARSDKVDPGVERTLTFDSPGTKEVSVVYRFGGAGFRNVSGAFHLEVLSPQVVRSDDAGFDVRCSVPTRESDAGAVPTPTPGSP